MIEDVGGMVLRCFPSSLSRNTCVSIYNRDGMILNNVLEEK
jgi:hypothetical protein